jgi:hypothetical protein
MTKAERIEALEIASQFDIETISTWWSPIQKVAWKVLESEQTLSGEQYYYLSMNKYLQVKEEPIKGEKVILTISETGKQKLLSLKA